MSVTELQELEEVKGLVLKGQQVGVLTHAEIDQAVSELDFDEADVEELKQYLEGTEIELVEELDPALEAAQEDRAPDKRSRRKAKTTIDLKPDMTTDSLQLFLKDIGKVRLLTAQEERAPDKRGRRKAKTAIDLKPDMTTDSLQLFLKDIGKVRLLTAQAEVDLARRIERGDRDAKQ